MTRMDDVINTSGHRISTGRLEEVINGHDQLVESAVVGYNEPMRGECPLAYCILRGSGKKDKTQEELAAIAKTVNDHVRTEVGAFARLIGVLFVEKLPKTRSGKILRGTIKRISNKQDYKMPATIDDINSLDIIAKEVSDWQQTLPEASRST